MPVTCRLHEASKRLPDALVERARSVSTPLVSDVSGRWAGAPGILPVAGLTRRHTVAGTAFTVRTRPGDNLVVHKAFDLAEPGDVVVVAAGGASDRAVLGGLLGHYAASRRIAALVVDGAIRDVDELDRYAPPTFAAGVSHLGPYKDGPGELRCPVAFAGLAVHDGDLVVADHDGVAIAPAAEAERIITAAEAKAGAEAGGHAAIEAGSWDRSWLNGALELTPADD